MYTDTPVDIERFQKMSIEWRFYEDVKSTSLLTCHINISLTLLWMWRKWNNTFETVTNPPTLCIRHTYFQHQMQRFCKGGFLQKWQNSMRVENFMYFDYVEIYIEVYANVPKILCNKTENKPNSYDKS